MKTGIPVVFKPTNTTEEGQIPVGSFAIPVGGTTIGVKQNTGAVESLGGGGGGGTTGKVSLTTSGVNALAYAAHNGKEVHAEAGVTEVTMAGSNFQVSGAFVFGSFELFNYTGIDLSLKLTGSLWSGGISNDGETTNDLSGAGTLLTIPHTMKARVTFDQDGWVRAVLLGRDVSAVKVTGDQTVAGKKTFSTLPEVSADATTANQLVRKSQHDTSLGVKVDDTTISRIHGQGFSATYALAHPVSFSSNSAVTGADGSYSILASSEYSSGFQAWHVFDNSDTTDHATQGVTGAVEWHIQITMPVGKIISRMIARSRASGIEGPTAFRIEGSNDNFTTKTTLHTGTMVLNNVAQTFSFTNTKVFTGYRFVATASSGTNPGLSRLEFHESVYAPSAHLHAQSDITSLDTALGLKAPLASPTFTGTPLSTTALAGTNTTQIATTAFVLESVTASQAGLDWKSSARVATTGNITLSGAQTIDGVSVIASDRVLVKDQTTASQNGLYDVATGAWVRSSDANANNEVTAGLSVYVESGTANSQTVWTLTTGGNISLGTTALTFARLFNTNGLEQTINKVTAFSGPTDTQYPSAKLVNDQLALKAASVHNHDALYFTESEVNNQFLPKSSLVVTPIVLHPENFAATTATGTAGTYTASASSEFNATYAGWKCFDNSDTTDWATLGVTTNFWVRMVLPAARIVTSVIFRGRNSGIERITSWIFQGSNDGTAWTDLLTSTTALGNTAQTFTIPNSTAYTQYRLFANTAEATNPGLSRMTLRGDSYAFNNPTV